MYIICSRCVYVENVCTNSNNGVQNQKVMYKSNKIPTNNDIDKWVWV